MSRTLLSTVAAVAISAASITAASAVPQTTPQLTFGQPFATTTDVTLTAVPAVTTPLAFSTITISGFGVPGPSTESGGNQTWDYSTGSGGMSANGHALPDFTLGTSPALTFPATAFTVEILGRSDSQVGTFNALLTKAAFSGTYMGQTVTGALVQDAIGTVTYTSDGGYNYVSTSYEVIALGCVGSDCQTITFPNPAVPEIDAASGAGAIGLLLSGLALVGQRRRRQAA